MKTRLFTPFLFVVLCLFSVTDFGQEGSAAPAQTPAAQNSPPPAALEEKAPPVKSQPATFEAAFKSGVGLYRAKNYQGALDAFAKAVQLEPHNAYALTNLALTYYQLGKKGLGIGLWRKALESDPELSSAQAGLKFALKHLETKEIPHQIENYETIRHQFLQPVTLPMYLLLTALFLFATGWTLLNYIGQRRQALQDERRLPGFPLISSLLLICLFISTALLGLKFYDTTLTRGTVIESTVSVQAAPGDNQVALFDLYEGFEVLVRHVDGDWVQVTYPGASTGWIKKSALLVTSGTLPN